VFDILFIDSQGNNKILEVPFVPRIGDRVKWGDTFLVVISIALVTEGAFPELEDAVLDAVVTIR
jgi:hypothetical protein